MYATRANELFVNLFVASKVRTTVHNTPVALEQQTGYPWQGDVRLMVSPATAARFTLRVRIPGWARHEAVPGDLYSYATPAPAQPTIKVNGRALALALTDGYASITRRWRPGDVVRVHLPLAIRQVKAHPAVAATTGQAALEYGPLVYCVEDADNQQRAATLTLPAAASLRAEHRPDLLGGVTVLTSGHSASPTTGATPPLVAIPYYAWSNRGIGAMRVWLPTAPAPAAN